MVFYLCMGHLIFSEVFAENLRRTWQQSTTFRPSINILKPADKSTVRCEVKRGGGGPGAFFAVVYVEEKCVTLENLKMFFERSSGARLDEGTVGILYYNMFLIIKQVVPKERFCSGRPLRFEPGDFFKPK